MLPLILLIAAIMLLASALPHGADALLRRRERRQKLPVPQDVWGDYQREILRQRGGGGR